ncbi:methyltransferase [Streptomyces sp. HD1123-B1]|uniref:methyltransferase n=1 Tax=Streptomyces huangiella TaxID=3228804 RepID=UPI003D7EAB3A
MVSSSRTSGEPAARSTTSDQGLNGQVEIIGGDFFDSVPTADIHVLSYMLHDWHDAAAMPVLRSVARAGGSGARVLIVEAIVPDGSEPHCAFDGVEAGSGPQTGWKAHGGVSTTS